MACYECDEPNNVQIVVHERKMTKDMYYDAEIRRREKKTGIEFVEREIKKSYIFSLFDVDIYAGIKFRKGYAIFQFYLDLTDKEDKSRY